MISQAVENAANNIPENASLQEKKTLREKLEKIDPDFLTGIVIARTLQDSITKKDGKIFGVSTKKLRFLTEGNYYHGRVDSGPNNGCYLLDVGRLPEEEAEISTLNMNQSIKGKIALSTDWCLEVVRKKGVISYKLRPFGRRYAVDYRGTLLVRKPDGKSG
jgi:hypothetical protein